MRTFIAEGVMRGYYDVGCIVVNTETLEKAMDLIIEKYDDYEFTKDCGNESCEFEWCLKHRMREMKNDEVVYIAGSE